MQAVVEVDGKAIPYECYYDGDGDVERVSVVVDDEGVMHHYLCTQCGESAYDGELDDRGTCEDDGPHSWERIPLSWLNHAAVDLDEKEDSITVSISVGDPRGAFTFTVRRIPDSSDNQLRGRLIMYLPYPGYPVPHEDLTPLHEGTYLIG